MIKSIFPMIFIFLLASTVIIADVQAAPTITVQTDKPSYTLGETVKISFSIANHLPGVTDTVVITINTPGGGVTTQNIQVVTNAGGNAAGTVNFPLQPSLPQGSYSVKASIPNEGVSSNSVPFTVAGGGPAFDFSILLSPTSITVEQGKTGNFKVLLTYSDPSYAGTVITLQVTGLGPGMNYQLSLTGDLKITTSSSTPPGTYPITVIGSAQGKTHQTSGTIVVTTKAPPFDFAVSISPSTQTIELKEITTYNVDVSLVSGTGEPVSLTLSGLPGDVTHRFSQSSGTPPFSTTLTVETSTSSSTGSYTLTVTGTGGGTSKTATATLTIKAEADFSITASPVTAEIHQGDSSSITVTVDDVGDFDQAVSLTATGLPSGATPQFSQASGKPSFTSILTIGTTDSTPPGTYTVTIDASGGGKTHSTSVTLTIKEKPQPTTTQTTSEQVTAESESNITATLSNPVYLAIIIIVVLAAALIAALARRGRPPPPRKPKTPTVYCISCREPISARVKHCPHCGEAQR
jgi:hypothetical protein